MLLTQGYSYNGAHANINVWNPNVDADDEYTSAQIWLANGPYNNQDSLQTGWTVSIRILIWRSHTSYMLKLQC